MRRPVMDDETRSRSQPASPSERIEVLRTALSEGASAYDVAVACSISKETVHGWLETGLYGDRSLAAIEELIVENRRRRVKLADAFIATFNYAGLKTWRDLQLVGFQDLQCGPLDAPVNTRTLRKMLLHVGRQSHLGAGGYVMLPGSDHHTGGTYAWEVGSGSSDAYTRNLPYAPTWMERTAPSEKKSSELDALDEVMRTRDRLPIRDIKDILDALPESFLYDYVDWIEVGKALHHHFGGDEDGRHLWHWHSKASGVMYVGAEIDAKWPTFVKDSGGVTMGTLIHAAGGWDKIRARERGKTKRRFLKAADLAKMPRPHDFVEGILYERCMSVWAGAPKAGKSYLLLDLAHAVASGSKWAGRAVDKGAVLVIPLEGVGLLYDRIRAWEIETKKESPITRS